MLQRRHSRCSSMPPSLLRDRRLGAGPIIDMVEHRVLYPLVDRGLAPAGAARADRDLSRKAAMLDFAVQSRAGQAGARKDGSEAKDTVGDIGHDAIFLTFLGGFAAARHIETQLLRVRKSAKNGTNQRVVRCRPWTSQPDRTGLKEYFDGVVLTPAGRRALRPDRSILSDSGRVIRGLSDRPPSSIGHRPVLFVRGITLAKRWGLPEEFR